MSVDRQSQDALLQPDDAGWYDRYQVVFATSIAILLIGGPAVVIAVLLAAGEPERLGGTVPFLVVGLAGWLLLHKGQLRPACLILVYGVWICSINALVWTHGLTGTTIGILVMALALAGWLAGPASAIILTVATPPVLYLFAYLEVNGWPVPASFTVTPYQRALYYSLTALGCGALGYFGAASLRERLSRLLGSERDLSARLAELQARDEALRRLEDRFETLFRSSPSATAITNPEGRILDCNQSYEELVGRSRADVVGRTSLDFGIWRNPEDRKRAYELLARDGQLRAFETEWATAGGEARTVLIYGEPLELNLEPCVLFHLVDITERKRAEVALEESEARSRSIVDAAFDGVMTHDRGLILDANRPFARLFGYDSPDDLIGRQGIELLLTPESGATIRERMAANRLLDPLEVTGIRKDGSTFLGETQSCESLHLGKTVRTVTMRDITARRRAEEALRLSERKYAAVFNTVPDALAVTRRSDGSHLELNAAWEKLVGHPRERALACTALELGIWADPAERAALLSRLDRDGTVVNFPARFARADGALIHVLVSAVQFDVSGEPCVVWSWTDISELQAAEQAFLASEKRYRSLFQAASDCILVIDRDGRLVDINDQGSRTLGYAREELLGGSFTRVLDAHLLSRLYPRPGDVLVERRSVRGEQELVSRNGDRHMVEFVASPLPDGNVLAIVRDVTERKHAEQLLINIGRGVSAEVGEAFFHSLVLSLGSHLGADYAFIGEVVATDRKRVRTRAFFADGEERPNFEYDLEGSPCVNALTRGGTVAYPGDVANLFPADAGLKRLAVQGYIGTSLLSVDGVALGILVVMSRRPIEKVPLWCSVLEIFASRAAAEIERSRAEREVRKLNLSLERKVAERTAELQAANRELESFTYTVSHDLRTPLRGITGFISLLRTDYAALFAGEPMQYFERIERGARRMGRLIDDLLKFSREGRIPLARELVPMRPIVDTVVSDLQHLWGDNARVEIGELPHASCDPALVQQVWQNLIGNALKFSSKVSEPKIEIGGAAKGEMVEYWVRDNGAGFDMAYADKLFGVFQRLHTTGEYEGTGIGLATVHRIVERHLGSVAAEGSPGRGATFRFTLPVGRLA